MNKRTRLLGMMVGLVIVLAGCGSQGGSTEPQPDVDATVQAAIVATQTAQTEQAPAESPTLPAETPTNTPTPQPGCTVETNALNLRAGPDLVFDPPITTLAGGTNLVPLAISPDGEWILVQAGGQTGWVKVASQFIACNFDIASLPVGEVPPTPVPTNTPAPAATPTTALPTPTPLALFIPPAQGNLGDLVGDPVIPQDALVSTDPLIFGDKIDIRLQVREPSAGPEDGAGIARVDVIITDEDNGDIVYQHTEQNSWFCAFGGGAPQCNQFYPAQNNYRWPNGTPIRDVAYQINMIAIPKDGNKNQGNWRFLFKVRLPQNSPQATTNLVANFVQIGPSSQDTLVTDALAFQVEAFDAATGNYDGAGIQQVDMRILDSSGHVVHERTERRAGYCAFGGGEPDCNVWVFAEHANQWPGGAPVQNGEYTLQAIVRSSNGATITVEKKVQLQVY